MVKSQFQVDICVELEEFPRGAHVNNDWDEVWDGCEDTVTHDLYHRC